MELTGRVIIFKDENEAKSWFELIENSMEHSKIESLKYNFESWKAMQERDSKKAPTE